MNTTKTTVTETVQPAESKRVIEKNDEKPDVNSAMKAKEAERSHDPAAEANAVPAVQTVRYS